MFRKLLVIGTMLCSLISLKTQAALPGWYLEIAGGYANAHMKEAIDDYRIINMPYKNKKYEATIYNNARYNLLKEKALANPHPFQDNRGMAGRLALGYQLNNYVAFEAGYLRLLGQGLRIIEDKASKFSESILYTTQAFDVAIKGVLPLGEKRNNPIGCHVFITLGIAYISPWSEHTTHYAAQDNIVIEKNCVFAKQLAPEIAIGFSQDISPNVQAYLGWTHIHPLGIQNDSISIISTEDTRTEKGIYVYKTRPPFAITRNLDFFSCGLSYHFG